MNNTFRLVVGTVWLICAIVLGIDVVDSNPIEFWLVIILSAICVTGVMKGDKQ